MYHTHTKSCTCTARASFGVFRIWRDLGSASSCSESALGNAVEHPKSAPPTSLASHPSLAYLLNSQTAQTPERSGRHLITTSSGLQSLARDILYALVNDKDVGNELLTKHLSPAFSANDDERQSTRSRAQHLRWCRELLESMPPGLRVEVLDSVVEVGACGRKATVWSFKRLSGLTEGGVCKEGVSVMNWERKGQVWVCFRLRTVRGVAGWV